MLAILAAILAGVSIVVARTINANLAERIGTFQGTFFNYIIGLSFATLFLLMTRQESQLLIVSITVFQSIPIWAYLGGIVGIIVIVLSNYIIPRISAFYLTLLLFIGQLLIGLVLDYITSNQLSIGKFIGGILVFCGLAYNLHIDYRQKIQLEKNTPTKIKTDLLV